MIFIDISCVSCPAWTMLQMTKSSNMIKTNIKWWTKLKRVSKRWDANKQTKIKWKLMIITYIYNTWHDTLIFRVTLIHFHTPFTQLGDAMIWELTSPAFCRCSQWWGWETSVMHDKKNHPRFVCYFIQLVFLKGLVCLLLGNEHECSSENELCRFSHIFVTGALFSYMILSLRFPINILCTNEGV